MASYSDVAIVMNDAMRRFWLIETQKAGDRSKYADAIDEFESDAVIQTIQYETRKLDGRDFLVDPIENPDKAKTAMLLKAEQIRWNEWDSDSNGSLILEFLNNKTEESNESMDTHGEHTWDEEPNFTIWIIGEENDYHNYGDLGYPLDPFRLGVSVAFSHRQGDSRSA